MTGKAERDADRPPWPWRGMAWIVALGSLLMAWGATQGFLQPDILIIEFFAAPGLHGAIMAFWALLLANAVPVIALLMGLRFWSRERETLEYRNHAALIMVFAGVSGAVITWCTVATAYTFSEQDRSAASADHLADKLDPDLVEIAQSLNANLPMQFNDGTRILGVAALDRRLHFKYQYTTLEVDQIVPAILREEAQTQSLRAACTDPDTRLLLTAGVTIAKSYVDKNHVHLATYEIVEADCRSLVSERRVPDEESAESSGTPPAREIVGFVVAMANARLPAGTAVQDRLISEGAKAEGEKVVYSYRFMLPKDGINEQWIEQISLQLPRDYCEKLSALAQAGISAEWRYVDSRGVQVLSVTGDPDSCSGDKQGVD